MKQPVRPYTIWQQIKVYYHKLYEMQPGDVRSQQFMQFNTKGFFNIKAIILQYEMQPGDVRSQQFMQFNTKGFFNIKAIILQYYCFNLMTHIQYHFNSSFCILNCFCRSKCCNYLKKQCKYFIAFTSLLQFTIPQIKNEFLNYLFLLTTKKPTTKIKFNYKLSKIQPKISQNFKTNQPAPLKPSLAMHSIWSCSAVKLQKVDQFSQLF
eukprot:TRINITY_DN647_c0_g1_i16.p3 TRINITY_DN647_c0_g1~~TRINITY_DN647_c0_g1_i16.p3  ORF type:complete len:208 (+),score=-7.33 TRINITY_DN647_c0_g1_i16:2598-3221(+)